MRILPFSLGVQTQVNYISDKVAQFINFTILNIYSLLNLKNGGRKYDGVEVSPESKALLKEDQQISFHV
jgi:hypothetical protein